MDAGVGCGAKLMRQEIDELVDEWEPEPLVTAMTAVERAEEENRPVFTGYSMLWNYFHARLTRTAPLVPR